MGLSTRSLRGRSERVAAGPHRLPHQSPAPRGFSRLGGAVNQDRPGDETLPTGQENTKLQVLTCTERPRGTSTRQESDSLPMKPHKLSP